MPSERSHAQLSTPLVSPARLLPAMATFKEDKHSSSSIDKISVDAEKQGASL